ncbi:MAG: hypothetical protein AAF368_13715 [Planctomycetota bacterium]
MYLPDRVFAKRIGLKHAGLYRGEVRHEDILALLQKVAREKRVNLQEYSIGLEWHTFPSVPTRDEHFHTYALFSNRIEISSRRYSTLLDLAGHRGRVLHPEIQAVGSQPTDRQRYVNYTAKEGPVSAVFTASANLRSFPQVLSDLLYEGDAQNPVGSKAPAWAKLAMHADTALEALLAIREEAPHVYLLNRAKLESTLESMFQTTVTAQYHTFRPSFQNLPLEKPLVLAGKSGAGKTQ